MTATYTNTIEGIEDDVLESVAHQLYCHAQLPEILWPRVFSWGECKDKVPYYHAATLAIETYERAKRRK